jgi:hypothetical protein
MKRVLLLLSASAVVLAGCAKGGSSASDQRVDMPPQTVSAPVAAKPAPAPPPAGGAPGRTSTPPGSTVERDGTPPNAASVQITPMLAYAYDYGIVAPAANIRALVQKEADVCKAAGAAQCEITGVTIDQVASDQVTGQLTLKATPAWLNGYEQRLASDAQGGGGTLTKTHVTTEDLSRQIIDTQAAVNAKTALRDRLQQMLQTRDASLSDLLEVQDKLTDAQADLDATNSELATMKERVATSDVTIEYSSTGVIAPQGSWSPLDGAISGAASVLAMSLAAIVYLVAFVLPWAAIIGGLLWLFRKRIFRPRKPAVVVPPPSPPTGSNPPTKP